MTPNDENAKLPPDQRPFRVLIISGSDRRQYNCPGVDSKSRALMLKMAEMLPQEWEIDYEDLGNVYARERIQSCNACVSTSMALCVWPCNCYVKNDSKEPDLMWNLDMYARVDMADAWAIIDETGRPRILQHKNYFDPDKEPFKDATWHTKKGEGEKLRDE